MTSKFFESFLAAGVGVEPKPEGVKKNLLCGIRDLVIVQGDVEALKEKIKLEHGSHNAIKWIRFMVLSEDLKVFLAIRYSNPFKADDDLAVYDIELVRSKQDENIETIKPIKGVIVDTIEADLVSSSTDLFK